ncbi:MAG: hypothetical protein ABUJ92_00295 [Desulfobacterales bacterium]
MSDDSDREGISFIIGMVIGGVISGFLIGNIVESTYKADAVKQGCAQYNPKTSDFEWIPNERIQNK